MTVSEKKLWSFLRHKRLGFLFRRQYPVGHYSLDFYCPEVKVCVEVDGPHHADREWKDAERDQYLEALGVLTIRIPSKDLFRPVLEKWLELIERACKERRKTTSTPGPV
ncbi:MAG: hypothetical protein QOJ65_459 [Fimbriimonadaceae bacterium]|jgi:very-short-patch-repair endonuclease|nr:hypothetical protein [Fimbriimonadaceae bacterium]